MAHLTGLFQRGSAYYIKIVLPKDHPLAGRYRNGRFVQSLGICSHRDAVRLGTLKRAEILWGTSIGQPATQPDQAAAAGVKSGPVPTPHAPSLPALTMRAIYHRWRAAKARSKDSEDACLRAVCLFEECLGKGLDLRTLTRTQGDEFRAWLLTKGATSKTSRDRFVWIKSLLKYAVRDLEALLKSPWEGMDIESKTTARRRPWKADELRQLFGQPLFARYELPAIALAGQAAAYWVPLIGLFTGARISELAQLRVEDVDHARPTAVMSITDDDGRHVKTEAGVRIVPVHPELVRLGFLEYVEAMQKAGHVSLWPALRLRDARPGGYLSAWFGQFRRAAGLTGKYPDFHCFRHTVRTLMARGGVSHEVQDLITGHEVQGSTGTRIYRHVDEADLTEAILCVRYPGLQLPRVYRA